MPPNWSTTFCSVGPTSGRSIAGISTSILAYDFALVIGKRGNSDRDSHGHGRTFGLHNDFFGCAFYGAERYRAHLRRSYHDGILGEGHVADLLTLLGRHLVEFGLQGAEIAKLDGKFGGRYCHYSRFRCICCHVNILSFGYPSCRVVAPAAQCFEVVFADIICLECDLEHRVIVA